MTARRVLILIVLVLVAEASLASLPSRVARADHMSYVVQPVYVDGSDQTNRFTTYQSKLDGYMTEARNWYKTAHLSTGDTFKMNLITWRTGARTLSSYCNGKGPGVCGLEDIYWAVLSDLGNPSLGSYLGYNPTTAKNVITEVFFDGVSGGSAAGLSNPWGNFSPYDPDGFGGDSVFGSYVMDSGAKGTAGHDGTIAHELGHTVRLAHNADSGNIWGNCALMGYNLSSCWDSSTFLVNGQGSDTYWYYEKYAVHYSPFTRIDGATSPPGSMSASQQGCGTIHFQWSLVSGDSTTGQTLLVAPRGTVASWPGNPVIAPANIFTGSGRTVVSLSAAVSSYNVSGLAPTTYYYWTVAPANSVGWVHGWPNSSSGVYLTC